MSDQPSPLQRVEALLDQLIQLQREEQEAILQRQPSRLQAICAQIDHVVMRLDDVGGGREPPGADLPACGEDASAWVEKLRLAQELAQQNQLLLDSHLRFLHSVFAELFPRSQQSAVYNAFGRLPSTLLQSGLILNAHS